MSDVNVRFWGVRGSVPMCSPQFAKYGGHTSCVSIESQGHLFILDAGTGMVDLGRWIQEKKYTQAHLLLSHFHYDHVLGFPFFGPVYDPNFSLTILNGFQATNAKLKCFFTDSLFAKPLFPVPFDAVKAKSDFIVVSEKESYAPFSGCAIHTKSLNHPGGCTGYALIIEGKKICFITDHEHIPGETDLELVDFIKNADLLIFDSMFSDEEFHQFKTWGHSTWQYAIELVKSAEAKQLAFFHHDPHKTDMMLDEIEAKAQQDFAHCFMARQAMEISI